jgi:hypothetical protein
LNTYIKNLIEKDTKLSLNWFIYFTIFGIILISE